MYFQDLKLSKLGKENVLHSHAEPQRAKWQERVKTPSVFAAITSDRLTERIVGVTVHATVLSVAQQPLRWWQ